MSSTSNRVERWGVFQLVLTGPEDGNPYLDVTLAAEFTAAGRSMTVPGFYDGDGGSERGIRHAR